MKYGLCFTICNLLSNVVFIASADHHSASDGMRCEGKAYYTLTFQAEWSNETHPSPEFPEDDAKFSPLIGATHSTAYEMWRRGKNASSGVQQVAETGKIRFNTLELSDRRRAFSLPILFHCQGVFCIPYLDV